MNRLTFALLATTAVATVAGISPMIVSAAEPATPTTKPTTEPMAVANKKCPVTKEDVDSSVATVDYKGKKIGFCCSGCAKTFNENPEKYMADLK